MPTNISNIPSVPHIIKVHVELPLRNSSSTLFQKYRVICKKKYPKNTRKSTKNFFQLIVFLLLNDFFTLENLAPQCPCMLKPFYAVSWVRCYFGYILIISASGLASEPETQSETGEIMVKVFDTLSKYFEDICPSTWFLKLLNSFNLEVIEMDGSIMIFGQNGFLGLNFFTFPGEGGQQYVTMGIMWSSGWAGLLQLNIWIGRPFSNDPLYGAAFCK